MQEIKLQVILDDIRAKANISALQTQLNKLKELGETGIKLNFNENGELVSVFSRLKDASGAIVDYVRTWDSETQKLEEKSAKVSYNFEQMQKNSAAIEQEAKRLLAQEEELEKKTAERARREKEISDQKERQAQHNSRQRELELTFANYDEYIKNLNLTDEQLEKIGLSSDKAKDKTKQLGDQAQKTGNQAKETSKAFTLMHTVFLRFAHTAISAVTKSFKEALTEIKKVDTELTTISRITQTSISNLDGLKDKAYEVGQAYGVLASDYLSAASAFTRAGYREQAEDLAELSSKLQVAGQVSAETANQLLIATDKSYKLNGSVTELSSVMDKMTYVDHNYATSVEKIAEGMGIVAPIASQAHMSIEKLIASLGTITAVTQRGGSESARALRALILSIIKDTKTEIDEGVTWTTDEINTMQDALNKYAKSAVEAAARTGELIDPMEAIAALAKSYEEGLLTEKKLAEITNSLGGKLRSSQLLSLIQNFSGMYTEMLNGMSDSMGIVDKDMERYLDSWEGKLNQLKSTFTEFVESLTATEAIKEFIDALRLIIQVIDNPDEYSEKLISTVESAFNKLVASLPRFQEAINRFSIYTVKAFLSALAKEMPTILKSLADGARQATDELAKQLPEIIRDLFTAIGEIVGQSITDSGLAADITDSLIEGIIEAIPQAIIGQSTGIAKSIADGISAITKDKSFGEAILSVLANTRGGKIGQKIIKKLIDWGWIEDTTSDALGSAVDALESATTELDSIHESIGSNTTDSIFKQETKDVERFSEKVNDAKKAIENYKNALSGGEKGDTFKSFSEAYKTALEQYEKGFTGSNAYMSAIDILLSPEQMKKLGWSYEKAGEELSKPFYKALFEGGGKDYGANAANYIKQHIDKFDGVSIKSSEDGTFSLMVTDMDAFARSAEVSEESLWALLDALDIYRSDIALTKDELLDLIKANEDAGVTSVNLTSLINDLIKQGKSEREIRQIVSAIQDLAETDSSIQLEKPESLDDTLETLININKEAEDDKNLEVIVSPNTDEFYGAWDEIKQLDGTTLYVGVKYVPDNTSFSKTHTSPFSTTHNSSSGGTHGGSSGSFSSGSGGAHRGSSGSFASGTKSADGGLALVNEKGAEIIYANGSAWVAGGGKPVITDIPRGAGIFNAKETREIFSRSGINSFDGGVVLSGIPDIKSSSGKTYKLTKNLEKILEELSKYVDKILQKAKDALDAQLKALDEQISALEREHNAEKDKNKLEELRLKILDAEQRLEEARNERTVRYFNKQTGQWEWMADQKAVYEAEQALKEAQEEYDKEVAEQEYQAQIQALKDIKEALQDQYESLEDHWEEILKAIEDSGEEEIDFEKLLKQLGLDGSSTGNIRDLIKAIQDYESKLASGTFEVPLDDVTTARVWGATGTEGSGNATLSQVLGLSSADANAKGTSLYNTTNSNIVGDTIYYINGVRIGSDMMDKPLSQILSVLPIYAN